MIIEQYGNGALGHASLVGWWWESGVECCFRKSKEYIKYIRAETPLPSPPTLNLSCALLGTWRLMWSAVSHVASTPSDDVSSADPLGLTKLTGSVDKDRRSKKK